GRLAPLLATAKSGGITERYGMSNKILRCGDDIDKSCHDIWLAVYTKEVTSQDQQRAEELAQIAVEK
ncbi:hypothetical protein, partial [Xanthomonas citri]